MSFFIKTIVNEPLEVNNYLAISEQTKTAILFDVGANLEGIAQVLEENGATLKAIFYTHGHFDHIIGGTML